MGKAYRKKFRYWLGPMVYFNEKVLLWLCWFVCLLPFFEQSRLLNQWLKYLCKGRVDVNTKSFQLCCTFVKFVSEFSRKKIAGEYWKKQSRGGRSSPFFNGFIPGAEIELFHVVRCSRCF